MTKFGWALAVASSAAALALATPAAAQGCTDPWVTKAIREVYQRAPNPGECDVNRYGGGQWNSYDQLKRYVNFQYMCDNAWVAQAVYDTQGRLPRGSGTAGECNKYLYGETWRDYPTLKGLVKGSINTLMAEGVRFSNAGKLMSGGVTLDAAKLIGNDGASLIGLDGGSIVSRDGAGLIGNDGASLKKYGLQSTSRKIKLPGGSTLIIP